jgi:hypothetical protein
MAGRLPLPLRADGRVDMDLVDDHDLDADEAARIDEAVAAHAPERAWDRALGAVLAELRGRARGSTRAPEARLTGASTTTGDAVVIAFRREPLVPAASDDAHAGLAEVSRSFRSADGRLTVTVEQTAQGHLVVTLSAAPPTGPGPVLVSLAWEQHGPRHMVVPLSERRGRSPSARYDLGAADAVTAAAEASSRDLRPGDVDTAFSLTMYGDALRAWEQLAARDDCPAAVRAALDVNLSR